ncbi:MAG: hypothetical protein PHE78_06325 [Candidatus Gastranaerophilales bacterium]|nr:hypothetical protein [Candidatus Gastranaerophilales bacterium]
MITNFNPSMKSKVQKQKFGAVVPKYLQEAKKAVKIGSGLETPVNAIETAVVQKTIKASDAIDTLQAIHGIYPKQMKEQMTDSIRFVQSVK